MALEVHRPGAMPSVPYQLDVGETVDDTFVINGFLGGGSMAEVYAAYDIRLQRRVAIKISRSGVDPRYLESEGRLLSSLQHPGVVAVHQLGAHRGCSYLALERLFGATLQAHLGVGGSGPRFARGDAIALLAQLAEVVGVIHGVGVLHRDLKPGNIMIGPKERVVLFDLGVGLDRSERKTAGEVVGSPYYMAPELLKKPAAAPHVSQDIYALGCIAYEMLAGRPPYDGDTSEEIFLGHRDAEVPRLPEAASGLLERVVRMMLAKDPADRPRSAEVVATWLRGVARGDLERARAFRPVSVLIADDDPEVRALLSTLVERRVDDVAVEVAADGVEALSKVAEDRVDVLLLDLEMPRLTGLELCMHLAGMPETKRVALCVISSYIDGVDRDLLGRLGVRRFIDKGAPPDDIVEGVGQVVRAAQRRRVELERARV